MVEAGMRPELLHVVSMQLQDARLPNPPDREGKDGLLVGRST